MMRRVPEVLDCWFESGSMPFAQVHYPFENAEWFEHHYPGDFIVEYIGQTRGWFYTLHVLATALFDRPAFRTCVSHGIVLGDDGQKMSKSLRNYPDPFEVFDTYGADAMRWYLLSSPILRGGDLVGDRAGHPRRRAPGAPAAVERVVLLHALRQRRRLHGAASRTDSTDVLDRYILAKTRTSSSTTSTGAMDAYDLFGACAAVRRSSTRSPTGTSAAAATASGPATPTPSTRCTPCSHVLVPRRPRRCCRSSPRRSTAASPASAACT